MQYYRLSANRRTFLSGVFAVRGSAQDVSFAKLFFPQRKAGDYLAALAALMVSIIIGTTLYRSPQMP